MTDNLYEIGFSPGLVPHRLAGGLAVGDQAQFALEFFASEPLRLVHDRSKSPGPSAKHIGRAVYDIVARVIHVRPNWWALDAGIHMFRAEAPPKLTREGSEVAGTCIVGVGTYRYEEHLFKEPDAPPLIHSWIVDRIERDETPCIRRGRGRLEHDVANERWSDVPQTEPWMDIPGTQEFILHCRRLANSPKVRV